MFCLHSLPSITQCASLIATRTIIMFMITPTIIIITVPAVILLIPIIPSLTIILFHSMPIIPLLSGARFFLDPLNQWETAAPCEEDAARAYYARTAATGCINIPNLESWKCATLGPSASLSVTVGALGHTHECAPD